MRPGPNSQRALIVAASGHDAEISAMLWQAGLPSNICTGLDQVVDELESGAGLGIFSEVSLKQADLSRLAAWTAGQPAWSDVPYVIITERAEGRERSPFAGRLSELLGNALFIDPPFHPTSLVSLVRVAVRNRRRQYESRDRMRELHDREEQLRIAQQAGHVGSFELFPTTGKIMLSEQFRLIWGLDREREYRFSDLLALVLPDDLERVRVESHDGTATDPSLHYTEYRITRPDNGDVRWIARRGESLYNPETGTRRFLGVIYDITAQKSVEERLEASEGALKMATDAAEVGTWDLDLTTDWMIWSDRTRAIFGIGPDDPCTMPAFYTSLHPDDREATRVSFTAALDPATRRTYDVEYRVIRPDGAVRWVAAKGRGVFDASGQCVRAVGTAIDITERKAAEGRHLLLLKLADVLQPLSQPREIMAAAIEMVGRHLGVSRIGYGQIQEDEQSILLETDYVDGVEHLQGLFSLDEFDPANMAKLRQGQTPVVENVVPNVDPARVPFHKSRALIAVPYLRDGRLRAVLYVNHHEPRRWLPEEVDLIEDVAARTWEAFERARAQDALRASEAQLRLVADSLPVLIGLADRNLVYRFANRAFENWFFKPPEQAIGCAMEEFMGGAAFAERRPYMMRALAGETVTFELPWPHRNGDERLAEVRYMPRRVPGGLDGFYIFVLDITDRKRAEALLRQRNETLQERVEERTRDRDRLWRLSQELMLVSGDDGAITSINPSVTRVLGWTEEDMIGRRLEEFLHPEDAAQALADVGQGAATTQFVNRYRSHNGSYRTLDWTAVRQDGSLHAIARDVTEEVTRREELAVAQDQLRQAQKMEAVGQLTGGIAHDFNNLLQGITGSLELTRRRISQGRFEDIERFISGAMTSAQRAAGLTHRLLAFSRRQPLDPKPVEANPLVLSMEDLLRRTLGEQIRLELVLAADLWPTLCDPNQLESAILNLCINARDAMPDGGLLRVETVNAPIDRTHAARLRDLTAGEYICIAVTDTGTGMSKETIDRAFDPFFTTKPIGQGTGLGLSMIYGFARQSEGLAKIDSIRGQGTTVRLYLPRHHGPAIAADGPGELSEDHRTQDGETVLVVEDEQVVRSLIVDVLAELGYRAVEAEDGPSALEILRSSRKIDLLVTDIGLPGLNGRQVADAARVSRPELKVLFMTGYAEAAAQAQGFLEPGMALIPKPFAMEALAVKIRQMAGKN